MCNTFTRMELSRMEPSKMQFFGRETEQKRLKKAIADKGQSVVLIYGRRRVGKSELIKHVLANENARGIYYECKQTSEQNNVASLSTLVSESFGLPPLAFSGIEDVLRFIFKKSLDEKILLSLDEYTYLRDSVGGMDSILKSLIDEYKNTSNLKLILCGSFVDTMKSLLEVQNPLYGRVDLSMLIEPMDYYDSALFYSTFSNEDKVKLYSVFGGIPYYNRLINPRLTAKENIMDLIVSEGSRLENEVSMNLRSELSKLVNANEVFEALSRGYSKFSDILSQSHVSSSPALADTLDKLVRMMVVVKRAPINDPNNRKKLGYYINDNLSKFYYRYIFRYLSQRSVMEPNAFYDRYIKEDFENNYVPKAFEEIAKQYLIRRNRSGNFPEPFDLIGTYYYDDPANKTSGEFDVVTQGAKGYIFYEVKYRKSKITKTMIRKEIEEVIKTGLNCYKYGFISRSGFDPNIDKKDLILIELTDLYE